MGQDGKLIAIFWSQTKVNLFVDFRLLYPLHSNLSLKKSLLIDNKRDKVEFIRSDQGRMPWLLTDDDVQIPNLYPIMVVFR